MECFFLLALFQLMPDHHTVSDYALSRRNFPRIYQSDSSCFWCQICSLSLWVKKKEKHSNCGVNPCFFFFIIVCITPWGHIVLFCISSSWFVYFFFCLDRLQHHNMKWCWQCTSLFFHHLATIVDGLYLKSIYCTKKWEGGKTVCAIKNTKIQFSHLRSGPIHISRVWYT